MASVHPNGPDNDDVDPDANPEELESEGESGDDDDPKAPQINYNDLEKVEGYEKVNFMDNVVITPPKAKELYGETPAMPFREISEISEDDVREAMLHFVAQHCCYGSKPAKTMTFTKIHPNTAFQYILETYSEGRSTKYVSVPHRGGPVDGPHNGRAPGPWEVPCKCNKFFKNQTAKIEVPHSSVVKPCQRCDATGLVTCPRCHGHKKVCCGSCWGSGSRRIRTKNGSRYRRCYRCGGRGRVRCPRCHGKGKITCPKCCGHGELRCFIQLTVDFRNHESDYVLEMTPLPDHLVKEVGGDLIFEQEDNMVWPLTTYPVAEINDSSARLIKKHKDEYAEERVLRQRQRLRAIPVTEVDYNYDGDNRKFWVYGLEKKVYCQDYPHSCCWGCHIL